MGVLEGVRVLDFGRYIAGPYCAALLAEYGAEVIRIEKRDGSEDRFVAPITEGGEGALFMQMNRNKLSMTLDPACARGREVVARLVSTADVVIANLPEPTLLSMGLDYETLRAIRPDIILTTTSAYGTVGPLSEQVGFDGVGQVMSGAAYLTGPEGQPYRAAVPWVDFGTALHSAFATVLALISRGKTGEGQAVTTSLLATALTFMSPTLVEQAATGVDRRPLGNRSHGSAPTDLFQTQDGWILVQVVGQPLYRRWAGLMADDNWLTDPRFADDTSRGRHGDLISARMALWCGTRTRAQALLELGAARIPAAPVLRPREAIEHPHVQAMGVMEMVDYPAHADGVRVFRAPAGMSATPGSIRKRPPTLGEHTDQILAALGYAPKDIAELRACQAV
ncbi:CoA transferase [Caulobacter sp. 3R27C2-B]|uniref:CaiB/BaiF CoA transferase family protein n=1 Tax=Caulobacter sp. 3R27C2-B TaxID=2502219 RepID=UPI0010F9FE63|nr:CoA transferase [Caulobacter sp. 3R27C2-B]